MKPPNPRSPTCEPTSVPVQGISAQEGGGAESQVVSSIKCLRNELEVQISYLLIIHPYIWYFKLMN